VKALLEWFLSLFRREPEVDEVDPMERGAMPKEGTAHGWERKGIDD
jgi:hypothetical protein